MQVVLSDLTIVDNPLCTAASLGHWFPIPMDVKGGLTSSGGGTVAELGHWTVSLGSGCIAVDDKSKEFEIVRAALTAPVALMNQLWWDYMAHVEVCVCLCVCARRACASSSDVFVYVRRLIPVLLFAQLILLAIVVLRHRFILQLALSPYFPTPCGTFTSATPPPRYGDASHESKDEDYGASCSLALLVLCHVVME